MGDCREFWPTLGMTETNDVAQNDVAQNDVAQNDVAQNGSVPETCERTAPTSVNFEPRKTRATRKVSAGLSPSFSHFVVDSRTVTTQRSPLHPGQPETHGRPNPGLASGATGS